MNPAYIPAALASTHSQYLAAVGGNRDVIARIDRGERFFENGRDITEEKRTDALRRLQVAEALANG